MSFSTVEAELPEGIDFVVTPYPPTPFQSLIFYCDDPISMGRIGQEDFNRQPEAVLIGPQFSRVNIKVHKRLKSVRVDFLPGGLFRMLGIPMSELFDQGFDAVDVFGAGIKRLTEQVPEGDLEKAKNFVEEFLVNQLVRPGALLPIDSALHLLMQSNGTLSMQSIASHSCLSMKQFERKCRERIGMNPKLYARILKFSNAYRIHESNPQLSWTKIAYEAGYFDQMHMIRDFKVFAGVNPSVIEQQLLATPLRMQKDLHY
jgi:AraC-like DNA-binding protein